MGASSCKKNDVAFKNNIIALQTSAALSKTYETGFVVDSVGNRNRYTPIEGTPSSSSIYWYFTLKINGVMHCHYAGKNSVFSPDDIVLLGNTLIKNLAKDSTNLYMVVTSSYGPPMLMKVKNLNKLRNFTADYTVGTKRFTKKIDYYKSKIINQSNHRSNEIGFLNLVNDMLKDGVELYRGTVDNNGEFTGGWTKLRYFGSTDLIEVPCGNIAN